MICQQLNDKVESAMTKKILSLYFPIDQPIILSGICYVHASLK